MSTCLPSRAFRSLVATHVVAWLTLGGLAHAQPKNTRSTSVHVDVNISQRVKAPQPPPKTDKAATPPLSADDALAIATLVGEIHTEQLAMLKEMIASTDDSETEEKADLYFRLGEIHAKQQRLFRIKSADAATAADASQNSTQKAKLLASAKDFSQKAKAALIEAVRVYQVMTANPAFRNYPKMDMALFYYGYTLQSGRYYPEARAAYDKLLKDYPKSKYVPEAHLAFADYYFETGDLDNADARYKQVLKFPKSNAFWYAMYKIGWIDLNRKKEGEAMEIFQKVAEATKNDPKQEVLHRATKKDYVRAYAEAGKAELAFNAFKRVDDKYAFTMLGLLADLYSDQGKNEKAIYTYREMIKTAPKDKNVCLWQYNVTRSMLAAGSTPDKIAEIENLVKLYSTVSSKKLIPAAELEECHDNAAAMSGELARAYHSESAKTRNIETLQYAEKLYKAYLTGFPNAQDYAQTQYYYADLLWARAEQEKNQRLATDKWEQAANAFADVVTLGKASKETRKEAAHASIQAWRNAIAFDPRNLKQPVDNTPSDRIPDKIPLTPREQQMLTALERYTAFITDPADEDRVLILFQIANLHRQHNNFDAAIQGFSQLLDKHRSHPAAEDAANLLLHTYNLAHRHDELLALAGQLAADTAFTANKPELKTRLEDIKITGLRKIAEGYEKSAKATNDLAKFVQCGQAYQDIFNLNPMATQGDEVLYNAGFCFEQGKSLGAAFSAYNKLRQYYPKSKHAARATFRVGQVYGDVAFYKQAAENLEEYAQKYAGEADAFRAMGDAVFFRKGLGDDAKAIEDTKKYVAQYRSKKPQDAAAAHFALASVYEKQGDYEQVAKHLREYLQQFAAHGSPDKVVQAHTQIGLALWQKACPVTTVDGACVKVARERALLQPKRGSSVGRSQCAGTESKLKVTVVQRDERLVKQALEHFQKAAAAHAAKAGHFADAESAAAYYAAVATFTLAEADYERYLAMTFPTGLDFDPRRPQAVKSSRARFDQWVAEKNKAGETARLGYERVKAYKEAAMAIAAVARLGQIPQNFADQLYTAEIPQALRADEVSVDAYCEQLNTLSIPLEETTVRAFTVCLETSTRLGWFSDWSRLCERELGQLRPAQYPQTAELRKAPALRATVSSSEPPVLPL